MMRKQEHARLTELAAEKANQEAIQAHHDILLMELPLIVSSPQFDVTYVQGYTVKNINAPIHKSIFKNHGDVAANLAFISSRAREFVLRVVCEVWYTQGWSFWCISIAQPSNLFTMVSLHADNQLQVIETHTWVTYLSTPTLSAT
ncbi:phospholipase-like protein [Artemisia annua]|uniref:Phospholipase-like protein n=1 Tax=Artemisia annua TaxID=35608 RepID=A0A2U1MYG6_ARTAN|nr:phospholipase-like protein [Artemisia annua]